MATVTIVQRLCDFCLQDGKETERATTYVLALAEGEQLPPARVLDCCEDHGLQVKVLLGLMDVAVPAALLAPKPATRPVAGTKAKRGRVPQGAGATVCPVCGHTYGSRAATALHVWRAHRGSEPPAAPTTCPECGREFGRPSACGVHRQRSHQLDVLTEAMAGVDLTQPQPELLPV